MTPLGRDVLPLVNWRNARSSGSPHHGLDVLPGGLRRQHHAGARRARDVRDGVEVAVEVLERELGVDGHRDDTGKERPEEGENELLAIGDDHRQAIPLAEPTGRQVRTPPLGFGGDLVERAQPLRAVGPDEDETSGGVVRERADGVDERGRDTHGLRGGCSARMGPAQGAFAAPDGDLASAGCVTAYASEARFAVDRRCSYVQRRAT